MFSAVIKHNGHYRTLGNGVKTKPVTVVVPFDGEDYEEIFPRLTATFNVESGSVDPALQAFHSSWKRVILVIGSYLAARPRRTL